MNDWLINDQFDYVTVLAAGNGRPSQRKFTTLGPFKKIRLLLMTPPLNKQRKFAFRLKYSTTTAKNKETSHSFDRFIYKVLRI